MTASIKVLYSFAVSGILTLTSTNNLNIKHDRVSTPVDKDDLVKILNESYLNINGDIPHENVVAGAWAQISLENAKGKKVWNYNLGNIGYFPDKFDGPYYSHFGKSTFKSFPNFIKGAEAYWLFLQDRCPITIKNFRLRDPRAAASSLKRCNYYRSDEELYSRNLAALYEEGLRRAKSRK